MENPKQTRIQAKVFDFAITELVHQHRNSFQPLWTVDSWVKFLIWMALNCGLSGERESLELFSEALGVPLAARMRRLFFERTFDKLSVRLLADPADPKILLLPLQVESSIGYEVATEVLDQAGLMDKVVLERSQWQLLDAAISIPWHAFEADSGLLKK